MKRRKSLSLEEWINQQGSTEVARLLKLANTSSVRQWRLGICLPKPEQMRRIKILTNGLVTYDGMIDPHFERLGK